MPIAYSPTGPEPEPVPRHCPRPWPCPPLLSAGSQQPMSASTKPRFPCLLAWSARGPVLWLFRASLPRCRAHVQVQTFQETEGSLRQRQREQEAELNTLRDQLSGYHQVMENKMQMQKDALQSETDKVRQVCAHPCVSLTGKLV